MNQKKVDIKKMILRLSLSIILIGGICVGLYFLFAHFGLTKLSEKEIQDYVNSTGLWAPLVFILISFLQVTFVPIPGAITTLAGKYLFGFWLSFLYSYIGMMLGSLLAFFLGRIIGRKFVNWVVGDAATVDYYLNKTKGKEIVVLFFMFLLPFFPDDALCALAGITSINWPTFILMQVITRFTSIGATLLLMSGEFIPYHGWGLIVLIILGILAIIAFILSYKNSDKINDWLIKVINKLFYKNKKQNDEKSSK